MDITSRDNRLVKAYRRLGSEAKARRESGLFVAEGARLCADAVRSDVVVETAFLTDRARVQYPAEVSAVETTAREVFTVPEQLLDYMADTDSPQGICCICRIPVTETSIRTDGCYAALERIQDPGNMGTMIRTAEAFGLDGMLLSDGCCDLYSPKVLRASMGGVFRLPILVVGRLADTLPTLGMRSYACVVDKGAKAVQDVSFGAGAVCVIGNEGNGLTPETVAACTEAITIPMNGRAESLNASMAAGIVFWEMVRGSVE